MSSDEKYIRQAILTALEGVRHGQTPFGACIVRDDHLLVAAHNQVWQQTDITAHAEIVAIRKACELLRSIDLSGCTIYCSCEPCPMCFAACHWARLDRIVWSASIADAAGAGFHELPIAAERMKSLGAAGVALVGGVLHSEGAALFAEWTKRPERRVY